MTRRKRNFEVERIGRGPNGIDRYQHTIKLRGAFYAEPGGSFKPVTNQLKGNGPHPTMSLAFDELLVGGFRPVAVPDRPVFHIHTTGRVLEITPLDSQRSAGERITRTVLHPYLSGAVDGVMYPEIWPNTDLVFEYAGAAINKFVVLRTGHPTTFRFALNREFLKLSPVGHALIDDLYIPSPVMRPIQLLPSQVMPIAAGISLSWRVEELPRPGRPSQAVLAVDLPPGDWSGWALDPTVVSQPDEADGIDCYIDQDSPTTNFPTSTTLLNEVFTTSHKDMLIRFPLDSIPAGSAINSMQLDVRVVAKRNSPSYPAQIHRCLVSWTENGATWNTRDGSTAWGTAGCRGANVDYFGDESVPNGRLGTWGSATLGPQSVSLGSGDSIQALFDESLGFHAFSLANSGGTDRGHQIASSNHATASYHPKLTVVYSPPTFGRLWAFSINPLGERVEVLSAQGEAVPVEELMADAWYAVEAPSLPTPEWAEDLVEEKRFAYAEEIEYTDPDQVSIASSTSEFADVVVARAAGRSAL